MAISVIVGCLKVRQKTLKSCKTGVFFHSKQAKKRLFLCFFEQNMVFSARF